MSFSAEEYLLFWDFI